MKWNLPNELNQDFIFSLQEKFNISSIFAKILNNRGIDTLDKSQDFLFPDIKNLHNPFLLPDIDNAVSRVKTAILNSEKILIYGDKDVDGQTSIVVLKKVLSSYNIDAEYYIPVEEGYGLHSTIVDTVLAKNIKLIITVDCGITNVDEVRVLKENGIDVVILDHHEPLDELPNAIAAVDPKRKDSKYPFRDICGCAVAFKFCWALNFSFSFYYDKNIFLSRFIDNKISIFKYKNGVFLEKFEFNEQFKFDIDDIFLVHFESDHDLIQKYLSFLTAKNINFVDLKNIFDDNLSTLTTTTPENLFELFWREIVNNQVSNLYHLKKFLDLTAIATIADIMSIIDENRAIVKYGLKAMRETSCLGLKRLMSRFSFTEDCTAKDVAWKLAPMINAAGRMKRPDIGVELFLSDDNARVERLSEELFKLNERRKALQENAMNECLANIDADKSVVFFASKKIDSGVTGIVATRLAKEYDRPAIVIAIEEETAVGSFRGRQDCDVVEVLASCDELLMRYGGHFAAGGFSLALDKIEEFKNKIYAIFDEKNDFDEISLNIDVEVKQDEISKNIFTEMKMLEPCSSGNPAANILIKDAVFASMTWMGKKGNHFKGMLKIKDALCEVIAWDVLAKKDIFKNETLDLVVHVEKSVFNDKETDRFQLLDLR